MKPHRLAPFTPRMASILRVLELGGSAGVLLYAGEVTIGRALVRRELARELRGVDGSHFTITDGGRAALAAMKEKSA